MSYKLLHTKTTIYTYAAPHPNVTSISPHTQTRQDRLLRLAVYSKYGLDQFPFIRLIFITLNSNFPLESLLIVFIWPLASGYLIWFVQNCSNGHLIESIKKRKESLFWDLGIEIIIPQLSFDLRYKFVI